MHNCGKEPYSGMAAPSKMLTPEEFASLLTVGNARVNDPAPAIPAEHSARLVALGYVADLGGRLRMTTPGRLRVAAGISNEVASPGATLTRAPAVNPVL
jgi:hypothetical protein